MAKRKGRKGSKAAARRAGVAKRKQVKLGGASYGCAAKRVKTRGKGRATRAYCARTGKKSA